MEFVRLAVSAGIARVTIDRQSKLNALNAQVLDELESCFLSLRDDEDVKVIVVTGAGEKAFVAGADIAQFPAMTPEDAEALSSRGQSVFSVIENSRKPVLAAVNGFALGGGCELAMACHLRYASDNAQFGQPEVKLGVIAGYGGTQRLPRLIGTGRALDILLSGRMVGAEEARGMGLVNEVFSQEDLLGEVEERARILMQQGPLALAYTLQAVYEGSGRDLATGLRAEAEAFRDVFDTEDRVEGAQAFLDRRNPEFKNR